MTYVGATPTTGDFKKLDSITTSSATTFNLRQGGVAVYPQSANHCIVSLNGVIQAPVDAFTIVNDTIVFASSLASSDVINFILVLGNVNDIGTVSDDTVSTAKIQANAVTAAKFNADVISGQTELAAEPADTDEFLVSDAGVIKRMDYSHIKASSVTGSSGFLAHGDGSTNQTISGAHAWTQITTFGTERYDIGSNFASNVFTAPADGKYYLSFRLTFANISGSFLKLRLQPLNNDLASNGTDGGDGNDHKTLGYSYILDMTSGQTAYPQVYSSASTVQVINNNGSYFCGMRIA